MILWIVLGINLGPRVLIGNERFSSIMQAAEVNILAAIHPTLVSRIVLTLPPSGHKDALLHELIDRTYRCSRDQVLMAKRWLSELKETSTGKTLGHRNQLYPPRSM